MDVVHHVDDAGRVVNVLQQRLAILALFDVDDMHRRTCRAVVDTATLHHHVVLRVLCVEREVAGRGADRLLDEAARKAQASVVAVNGSRLRAGFDAARNAVREAYGLEDRQHALVDPLLVGL